LTGFNTIEYDFDHLVVA